MGSMYLDDAFFDHPKALAAGEDAANLMVRILAWAHRRNTGHLPAAAVATLTTKRNTKQMVMALVKAGLLHQEGDVLEIHDWYERNAKMQAKREQAKEAANARWQHRKPDAVSNANAYAESMRTHSESPCENVATAMPNDKDKDVKSLVVLETHEDFHNLGTTRRETGFVESAIDILARRDMASSPSRIGDTEAWLRTARQRRRDQHGELLRTLDLGDMKTPEVLADVLEPPRLNGDQRPLLRDQRPRCPECGSSGMLETVDGCVPCPHCNTTKPATIAAGSP